LPEKNRVEAVIGILDATAKSTGEIGRLPRDILREVGEKYKVNVADELIGKLQSVTMIMPARQDLPKGGKPGPMLVLHTTDPAAAGAWQDFMPKLLGDLAGASALPQTSSETISGVKVFTISGGGLRWNAPVHFARSGAVVAIGLDRKLVAASVAADAAASVVAGEHAVSLPGGDSAALCGVIALGDVLPRLFEKPRPGGPVVPIDEPPMRINGQPIPESVIEEMKKARRELAAALATMQHATLTARRIGSELRFELVQPKVQTGSLKTVIDAAANWLDRSAGMAGNNRGAIELDGLRGRW
jgi:hypothetical protein